jgi:LacI family transcriptional regulator
VSASTVSRVLTGDGRVSATARAAVLVAIEDLAYVPSAAARGLASRRTGMIGVCLAPTAGEALPHLELAAWEAGLALTVVSAPGPALEGRVRSMVGRAEGVVVVGDVLPPRLVERIAARVPVVHLGADVAEVGAGEAPTDDRCRRAVRALAARIGAA